MNSKHPDYPELLHNVIFKMREVVKDAYLPFVESAPIDDIVNYELHVTCSFLMNFLIRLTDTGKFANGEKMTVDHAYIEFSRIMASSIEEWKEDQQECTEMTEH